MFKQKTITSICFSAAVMLFGGCGLNPQEADLDTNESLPEAKDTIFNKAINTMGLMTEIYGNKKLKIMAQEIADTTGTSVATNAEIPRDVTEMVKSTLNGIGGNVIFIPYDPVFMQNTAGTGYSDWGDKIVPEVVVQGGITEFDRALVTKGDSTDVDVEIGKEYGLAFSDQNKASLASVTLDFNLIDFKTFTGIPRIQAVNSVKLNKSTKEDSIAFTVKSATFGVKGDVKKVQGRHAAVRMIVQLSMVEIVGKYLKLPYWRLLPGASEDEIVIESVVSDFYAMTKPQQIAKAQEYLYLTGYPVKITGQMDSSTQTALQQFAADKKVASPNLDQTMYLALFENIPIDPMTRQKRRTMQTAEFTEVASVSAPPPAITQASRQSAQASVEQDSGNISLTTNKPQFKIGEQLKVNFSVDEPMYVRLVVINSKGEVSTLFPNPYQNDNYCKPGKKYTVPPSGADFSLDIGGPAGTDKLRAVASKKPIPADALHFTADGNFDEANMSKYPVRAAVDYSIVD